MSVVRQMFLDRNANSKFTTPDVHTHGLWLPLQTGCVTHCRRYESVVLASLASCPRGPRGLWTRRQVVCETFSLQSSASHIT